MIVLGRATEWQMSYWVPKGEYRTVRSRGLAPVRRAIADLAPWLGDRVDELRDWNQTATLTVESSRLPRWYRDGLLLIGDAAHVMSPVGGVGINLAIQDAVATSNMVGPALRAGKLQVRDLAAVQRRRELPTRLIQLMQNLTMHQIMAIAEFNGARPTLVMRVMPRLPLIGALRDRLFARGGFRSERVLTDTVIDVRSAQPSPAVA
jgi:2-polyprenyl-6-methoxyphenol hydroxylase-like FAD-dependent oxidoreductase